MIVCLSIFLTIFHSIFCLLNTPSCNEGSSTLPIWAVLPCNFTQRNFPRLERTSLGQLELGHCYSSSPERGTLGLRSQGLHSLKQTARSYKSVKTCRTFSSLSQPANPFTLYPWGLHLPSPEQALPKVSSSAPLLTWSGSQLVKRWKHIFRA